MRNIHIIPFVLLLLAIASSCQKDETSSNDFLEPISLHLTYQQLGQTQVYQAPPVVTMTNNTEQITSTFQCDNMGHVVLEHLLPGEYTLNVTSQLTAKEMKLITGNEDATKGSLSGFLSNLKLKAGMHYDLKELKLIVSSSHPIILKELYYAGSRTASGMTYRNDGFYTIHNNSIDPVDIGDYYIASVENFGGRGVAGPLWPGETTGYYQHIYAMVVWKIVSGNNHQLLQPGEDAVIAVMGAPHNKNAEYNLNSPVDLSNADYEAYIANSSNNYPDFSAKNMQLIFWPDFAYLWRISVFGQGMVLLKATSEEMAGFEAVTLPESFQDPFEDEQYWLCKKIPIKYVMDAVDLIENKTTTNTKRFPPVLDAGAATVGAIYEGKSVIRKVQETRGKIIIYQDTNNSTEDFEINDTPLSK